MKMSSAPQFYGEHLHGEHSIDEGCDLDTS